MTTKHSKRRAEFDSENKTQHDEGKHVKSRHLLDFRDQWSGIFSCLDLLSHLRFQLTCKRLNIAGREPTSWSTVIRLRYSNLRYALFEHCAGVPERWSRKFNQLVQNVRVQSLEIPLCGCPDLDLKYDNLQKLWVFTDIVPTTLLTALRNNTCKARLETLALDVPSAFHTIRTHTVDTASTIQNGLVCVPDPMSAYRLCSSDIYKLLECSQDTLLTCSIRRFHRGGASDKKIAPHGPPLALRRLSRLLMSNFECLNEFTMIAWNELTSLTSLKLHNCAVAGTQEWLKGASTSTFGKLHTLSMSECNVPMAERLMAFSPNLTNITITCLKTSVVGDCQHLVDVLCRCSRLQMLGVIIPVCPNNWRALSQLKELRTFLLSFQRAEDASNLEIEVPPSLRCFSWHPHPCYANATHAGLAKWLEAFAATRTLTQLDVKNWIPTFAMRISGLLPCIPLRTLRLHTFCELNAPWGLVIVKAICNIPHLEGLEIDTRPWQQVFPHGTLAGGNWPKATEIVVGCNTSSLAEMCGMATSWQAPLLQTLRLVCGIGMPLADMEPYFTSLFRRFPQLQTLQLGIHQRKRGTLLSA